jgi:hypothetical protein
MKRIYKTLMITTLILIFEIGLSHAKIYFVNNSFCAVQSDSLSKAKRNEIIHELDSILNIDQNYRQINRSVRLEFGIESDTIKKLRKVISYSDSLNLKKVTEILDHYGWLGSDEIGYKGNRALFFIIQHSNKSTMEKYLPMMKEAVTKGNAEAEQLALLVDRVEVLNDRPQIYGSQITSIGGKIVLYKTKDLKNVDKRRAEVGLGPLEEYLKMSKVDYIMPDN